LIAGIVTDILARLRRGMVQNNGLYYASQIFMLASPILVLPYLGRTVGPLGIGLYGSGQAWALLITTLVEFNMLQSASRQAAKIRGDMPALRALAGNVFGAKVLLSGVALAAFSALSLLVPIMQTHVLIFAMATVLGVVQGHTVYWFFGGTGNLQFVAMTDVVGRVIGVVAIFLFVHSPAQLWVAFLCQALGAGAGILAGIGYMMCGFIGYVPPDFTGGLKAMRENTHLFIQNFIGALYTGATALIVGMVCTPVSLGYFSAAERMVRAGVLPAMPLRQTFFPSVVSAVHRDVWQAMRSVRLLLFAGIILNTCISLALFLLAGPIIRLVFGPGFSAAVPVLQTLAILPLLLLLQDILGNLWLIPLHYDRYCTFVVMVSGAVHIASVAILGHFFGAVGAALGMLVSNCVATLLIVTKVIGLPLNPLTTRRSSVL
jgi:O-antigen/teichoic acid export membrane protein